MSGIVQQVIDHPEWERGDVIERWKDGATGYECMMRYGPLGGINGYVAVPEGHPWHGMHYNDAFCGHEGCYEHTPGHAADIADTVTFGDCFDAIGPQWWFGFTAGGPDRAVEDMAYVQMECEALARQLKAAAAPERATP